MRKAFDWKHYYINKVLKVRDGGVLILLLTLSSIEVKNGLAIPPFSICLHVLVFNYLGIRTALPYYQYFGLFPLSCLY
jgi:hypothetical protein